MKKEGKKSTLTDKRILELEAIGFVWKPPRGGKRVKSTATIAPTPTIEGRRKRNGKGTSKKKRKQEKEEPKELERIRMRRIVKERLKNWRRKPGSTIHDLL